MAFCCLLYCIVDTSLYTLRYTFQQIAELLILLKPDFDHKVCFIISNLIQECPYFLFVGFLSSSGCNRLSDIFLNGSAVMTPPTTGAIFQLVDPAGKTFLCVCRPSL